MADEITITAGMSVTNGSLTKKVGTIIDRYDMAGSRAFGNVQDVGTTYELVATGADVGTEGWSFYRNLDATNFLELGLEVSSAFYAFAKLMPGEMALLPISSNAIYAKADTAACKLQVDQVER